MKKILSLLLTFGIICTNIAYAKDYSNYPQKYWDLDKSHWAYSYISELTDKNVIEGFDDGSFKPDKTVTRAEWSKLICTASGKTIANSDVTYAVDYKTSDWYSPYINTIKDYINFYVIGDKHYFKPNQAITREDITVSLVKLKGYDLSEVDYSNITQFSDFNSISNSLKVYISVAISNNLIKGFEDNTFRAQDTLTRAEAATLLCRAFQLGDINKGTEYNSYDEVKEDIDTNSEDYYKEYYSDLINSNKNNTSSNIPKKEVESKDNLDSISDKEDKEDKSGKGDEEGEKYTHTLDTLVKAEITPISTGDVFYYTVYENNLYYFDKKTNDIIKFGIYENKKEKLLNTNELEIEYEDVTYKGYNLIGLFYDTYSDSLVLHGYFSNKKFDVEKKFPCLIELNDMNIISDFGTLKMAYEPDEWNVLEYLRIYGVKNNGDYLACVYNPPSVDFFYTDNCIINRNSHKVKHLDAMENFCIPYYETKNNIYYAHERLSYLYKADKEFSKTDCLNSMLKFVGFKNNICYTICSNAIVKYDFEGNNVGHIMFDEIDIVDDRGFNQYSYDRLFFITENEDLVFYDSDNLSFRMISKK